MKSLRRWIFNLLTALSLIFAFFLCYLYFRSHHTVDFVSWNRWRNSTTHDSLHAMVHWGRIRFAKKLSVETRAKDYSRDFRVSHSAWPLGSSDYHEYVEGFRIGRPGSQFAQYPLGIWTYRESVSYERNAWTQTTSYIVIPVADFIALALILPLAFLLNFVRCVRRRGRGLCPACGYDLRASPERCPECGQKSSVRANLASRVAEVPNPTS